MFNMRKRKEAEVKRIYKELLEILEKRLEEVNDLKIENRKLRNRSHIGLGSQELILEQEGGFEPIVSKNYQTISSTGTRDIQSSTSQATGWYCPRLGIQVVRRGAGRQVPGCGCGRGRRGNW